MLHAVLQIVYPSIQSFEICEPPYEVHICNTQMKMLIIWKSNTSFFVRRKSANNLLQIKKFKNKFFADFQVDNCSGKLPIKSFVKVLSQTWIITGCLTIRPRNWKQVSGGWNV